MPGDWKNRRVSYSVIMTNAISRMILASALLATAAMGQTPAGAPTPKVPSDVDERFRKADVNHDGRLSRDEAARGGFAVTESFGGVDNDGDGLITLFEIGEFLTARAQEWTTDLGSADTDADQRLSETEAAAVPSIRKVFQQADLNRDGQLDATEYDSYSQRQLYRHVDMPHVVPNIIDKRF